MFNINKPSGLKFLARLRISFSHLKQHEFEHNFQYSADPFSSCGNDIESTTHFFLRCEILQLKDRPFPISQKVLLPVFWLKMKIQSSEHSYLENQTLLIQLIRNY